MIFVSPERTRMGRSFLAPGNCETLFIEILGNFSMTKSSNPLFIARAMHFFWYLRSGSGTRHRQFEIFR